MGKATDDLKAVLAETRTVNKSILTLIDKFAHQVLEAKEDPDAIEAIVAEFKAENKALADAVVANTPAEGNDQTETVPPTDDGLIPNDQPGSAGGNGAPGTEAGADAGTGETPETPPAA